MIIAGIYFLIGAGVALMAIMHLYAGWSPKWLNVRVPPWLESLGPLGGWIIFVMVTFLWPLGVSMSVRRKR